MSTSSDSLPSSFAIERETESTSVRNLRTVKAQAGKERAHLVPDPSSCDSQLNLVVAAEFTDPFAVVVLEAEVVDEVRVQVDPVGARDEQICQFLLVWREGDR